MSDLDAIGDAILERLEEKNDRREEVLAMSRKLVQHAARAIRAVHRAEWDTAESALDDAHEVHDRMCDAAAEHPDISTAGYTLDAQAELAEAELTMAVVRGDPLPSPTGLEVDDAAWLNGLGDTAGELRRVALDRLRGGDIEGAEEVLEQMQEIHTYLSTIDFPKAITRNIKRKNDMVRAVTERTRGDLTMSARQEGLKAALDRFEQRMTEQDA